MNETDPFEVEEAYDDEGWLTVKAEMDDYDAACDEPYDEDCEGDEEYTVVDAMHMMSKLDTMDAMVWAEEFAKTRERVSEDTGVDIADDNGTMLAWFANAIMKGFDHGVRVGEENGVTVDSEAIKNKAFEDVRRKLDGRIDIQSMDGNWNVNSYMHGYLNGMILAKSILDDEEPDFWAVPEGGFLVDKEVENDCAESGVVGIEPTYEEKYDRVVANPPYKKSESDNFDNAMKLVR